MNYLLEFHDSEIQDHSKDANTLLLRLYACIHESEGEPGVDDGICYFQGTNIKLTGYEVDAGDLIVGRISDGAVFDSTGGDLQTTVPLLYPQPSTLSLTLTDGSKLSIRCETMSIEPDGPKSNAETFSR